MARLPKKHTPNKFLEEELLDKFPRHFVLLPWRDFHTLHFVKFFAFWGGNSIAVDRSKTFFRLRILRQISTETFLNMFLFGREKNGGVFPIEIVLRPFEGYTYEIINMDTNKMAIIWSRNSCFQIMSTIHWVLPKDWKMLDSEGSQGTSSEIVIVFPTVNQNFGPPPHIHLDSSHCCEFPSTWNP